MIEYGEKKLRKKRIDSDEIYVLNLISEIIGEKYIGQYNDNTLLGDPAKSGQKRKLPVDAYFKRANIIIEYREKQHYEPVNIMDMRMTISGVNRGEQRKIYDLRKEEWAKNNKKLFLEIPYFILEHKNNGKLKRDKSYDLERLKAIIKAKNYKNAILDRLIWICDPANVSDYENETEYIELTILIAEKLANWEGAGQYGEYV